MLPNMAITSPNRSNRKETNKITVGTNTAIASPAPHAMNHHPAGLVNPSDGDRNPHVGQQSPHSIGIIPPQFKHSSITG